MFPTSPPYALLVAHRQGDELRSAAAAHRLRATHRRRRAVADVLRRAADHLDPAPLARPGLAP